MTSFHLKFFFPIHTFILSLALATRSSRSACIYAHHILATPPIYPGKFTRVKSKDKSTFAKDIGMGMGKAKAKAKEVVVVVV